MKHTKQVRHQMSVSRTGSKNPVFGKKHINKARFRKISTIMENK